MAKTAISEAQQMMDADTVVSGGVLELELSIALESDAGPVRDLNEDYAHYFVPTDDAQYREKGTILLVADGMGGHQAGEVASRGAVERVVHEYYADSAHEPGDSLVRALRIANQMLYSQAQADPSKAGMGTTMVAAVVLGRDVYVVNVGDSRAYLVSKQGINLITEDHSWVEEQVQAGLLTREQAERHPQRNLITRALGAKPSVEVDLFKGEIHEGDVLLLCSDGLSGSVSDQQMASIAQSQPPPQAAAGLVAQAKAQQAEDNISVLIVRAADAQPRRAEHPPTVDEEASGERGDSAASPVGQSVGWSLSAFLAWVQNRGAEALWSREQRLWLLVALAASVFLCCLCGALAGFPALGQRLTGDPLAAPQVAPIQYESFASDDPGWWAEYLGYSDVGQMNVAHQGQLELDGLATVDLWPARRGSFVVGLVRDWNCRAQTCAFYLEMAGKQYRITSDQRFFVEKGVDLSGRWVRVFGDQEKEGDAMTARLMDRKGSWWVWWQLAWTTVYLDYDWSQSVWVYGVADRSPYSPVQMGDYPGLVRGDRILMRGSWLQGEPRETISFGPDSLYRLEGERYVPMSGQPGPLPRPTVTLQSSGR